jgi:hypothetical protein
MSNPQINKQDEHLNTTQNDLRIKRNICLFNFSNLKSISRLSLSDFNSFKYDLSGKLHNKFEIIPNNNVLGRNEGAYIKNITINIPSAEKLSNKDFKNDFMKDFDDSYAHFCGLNAKQYTDAYINNTYIPNLNEIGDLSISINTIFEILKTFSDSKRVKISRKLLKSHRLKRRAKSKILKNLINKSRNIFRVLPKNNGKEIKQIVLEKEDSNFDDLKEKGSLENDNKNKNKLINNFENTPSLISIEYENQSAPKSKTLLNIKKNLKNISIPGSNDFAIKEQNQIRDLSNLSLEQKIKLNSKNLIFNNNNLLINDNFNSNDNKKLTYNASQNIPLNSCQNSYSGNHLSHRQLHNSNDNVFSFSSNLLQNYESNSQNKDKNEISDKHLCTPFNNNSSNNNLNLNTPPIVRPILNIGNFSPNLDNNILSPNSYIFSKSNIPSPLLLNPSPFNNNMIFNDAFTFNNVNTSAFIFGHNKSENGINSCENSNITVNNDKPNDNGENIFIHDQEGKNNERNEEDNNVNLNKK